MRSRIRAIAATVVSLYYLGEAVRQRTSLERPVRSPVSQIEPARLRDKAVSKSIAAKTAQLDITTISGELQLGNLALADMIEALIRPGRDPREDLPPPPKSRYAAPEWFDEQREPGGVLRSCVPSFRLPREVVDRDVDMVILSVGLEPRADTGDLAGILGIEVDDDGWFAEIRPVGRVKDGLDQQHVCSSIK